MNRKYSALAPWDQSLYAYEFEPFEIIPTKTNFNLIQFLPDPIVFELLDDLVIMQFELPNCLIGGDPKKVDCFKYDHKVKKIITTDLYSVEYFNKLYGYEKLIFGFTPFNPKYTPPHGEKIYDVYYTGHAFNSAIRHAFPVMEKFNHCFVCADYGNHRNVTYQEKLALNAQSKISIVHAALFWPPQYRHVASQFEGHGAFEYIQQTGLAPQMKTRIIEAAASKSLIICLQDSWNLIDSYFEKDKDFICWSDINDLEEKIHYVLSHYDEFQPMIESAYNTLMNNFTTAHFFQHYLKNI